MCTGCLLAYAGFKAMALEQNLSEQKRERNREFERVETHARLLQQPVERQQREVQEATIVGVVSPFGRDPEVVASEVANQVGGKWEVFLPSSCPLASRLAGSPIGGRAEWRLYSRTTLLVNDIC